VLGELVGGAPIVLWVLEELVGGAPIVLWVLEELVGGAPIVFTDGIEAMASVLKDHVGMFEGRIFTGANSRRAICVASKDYSNVIMRNRCSRLLSPHKQLPELRPDFCPNFNRRIF
jgi:hypothetical protein